MPSTRVLMIEDDDRLARMVVEFLKPHGLAVRHVEDATSGFAAFKSSEFDLILLDLMLPDADGMDVCAALKREMLSRRDVPIIMITARGDLADRVVGLELGADDYLPKPFEPRELLARIRAVLRRAAADRGMPAADVMRFGRLEIDRAARQVKLDRRLRPMTSLQFDLLVTLAKNAGRVLSRDQLRRHTRGKSADAFDRSIDVHIGRIRAAIEDDCGSPARIVTVRNVGYVFSKHSAKDA
jgi:DNA-binding response OmpR family regulator